MLDLKEFLDKTTGKEVLGIMIKSLKEPLIRLNMGTFGFISDDNIFLGALQLALFVP